MKVAEVNGNKYNLCSGWNEINKKIVLEIAKAFVSNVTPVELKLKCLLLQTGWKVIKWSDKFDYLNQFFKFQIGKEIIKMHRNDVQLLASSYDFLFSKKIVEDDENIRFSIKSKLTKNLIPEITINGIVYRGPSDLLTNVMFNEYKVASTYLARWIHSHDESDLNTFCAALYRPCTNVDISNVDFKGDKRERFNDFILEERAKLWNQVPIEVRHYVFLFYSGCMLAIKRKFLRVFPNPHEHETSSGKSKFIDPFDSYQEMTDKLSNGDLTKQERVNNTHLWAVLYRIEFAMKAQEELEAKLNKKQ